MINFKNLYRYTRFFLSSLIVLITFHSFSFSKPRIPLPFDAFDGGFVSAESLGRGATIASNRGTPASASENPASLGSGFENSFYSTILLDPSSSLDKSVVNSIDPLKNKTLQYLALGAGKGVIFFEPLARRNEIQIVDPQSPSTDFRDVRLSANAIGFSGVEKFRGNGHIGLSMAYLWSTITADEHRTGQTQRVITDTMDGFRLNLGVRYPTGPTMWGLSLQNAPAFMWGKEYKRSMLPTRLRIGNTWRLKDGYLLSAEAEKRFYNEGGKTQNYYYVGNESFVSKNVVLRVGVFGKHLDKSKERHLTAGASFQTKTKTTLSYAFEVFEYLDQKIKRSFISFQIPVLSERDSD